MQVLLTWETNPSLWPKKLTLIGYGKMNRLIDQLTPEYDFETVQRLTTGNCEESLEPSDVAIEFYSSRQRSG